jgi:predicted esterase
MAATLRAWRASGWVALFSALFLAAEVATGDTVTLKNGMTLDGSPSTISSLKSDPLSGAGETSVKQILIVDNQLTRTFVPTKQIAREFGKPPAVSTERITLFQHVPAAGQQINVVGRPLRIDPFDEYGHRIYSMVGAKGKPYDLVQGITEITPRWTRVEAIEGINHYILGMRIATSSIPRAQLSKILYNALDAKDATQRLRIVRLYMQSERFEDARQELQQVIKDFPDLDRLNDQVKELHQLGAQRIIKEIELRREAGQYRLVVSMLESFPAEGVAGETLIKVREMLGDIRGLQSQGHRVLKLLDDHSAAVKAEAVREEIKPIVAEMKRELNINTLDRMADYLRLADDAKMPAEQKLSLAISGWLLGSGAAIDNLAVSVSLVKVRDLVRQYMVTTRQPERDNILSLLTSQEAATNNYIAAILAHMKPPVETAVLALPAADVGNPAALLGLPGDAAARPNEAPPAKGDETGSNDSKGASGAQQGAAAAPKNEAAPAAAEAKGAGNAPAAGAAQATETPGLFVLYVKTNMPEYPQVRYYVQLPPEYDPYRRYPCIVTLHGAATTPIQQIDWWAGDYKPESQTRFGQATRHGYIVIAPEWTREHQRDYEYSAREHASVLLPLRDACKRFAIDVDRVFLSGHSMGGTAAWDMGLAHPDLWAGMIPIVAAPGKYITSGKYSENAEYVPMYFVCGEKDSATYACFTDWERYLRNPRQDVVVSQYLGRGHESFFDEIQNLFLWMNLHKRDFAQKEFKVQSLRPWDNFFWWVETADPKEINVILPAEWGEGPAPAKTPRPAETKTSALAPNGLSVTSGSCGKVRVWLSPDLVTFNDTLKVVINGKRHLKIQPRIETLLEDVRTRGDRQHPFWAKVEN